MKTARQRKRISLTLGALAFAWWGSSALAEDPVTEASVPLAADTWVSKNPPHRNYGGEQVLIVGAPNYSRTLVRADTHAVRSAVGSQRLVSARLELTVVSVETPHGRGAGPPLVDLHAMTTAWTEAGATWFSPRQTGTNPTTSWAMDSRGAGPGGPAPFAPEPAATANVAAGQAGVVSFDVTSHVAAYLGGVANHGWLLKRRDEEAAGQVRLASRESATPPRLVLTLAPPPSEPITLTAVSGDGQAAGVGGLLGAPLVVEARGAVGPMAGLQVSFEVVSGDATLVDVRPFTDANGRASTKVRLGSAEGGVAVRASTPGASPVVFQLAGLPVAALTAGADTYVSRIGANVAHGSEPVLRVGPIGRKRTLVRFDPDAVRALVRQEEIESARLELTLSAPVTLPPSRASFEVGAHRLTQAWSEQGATWNSPDDSRPMNRRRDGPRWDMARRSRPFVETPSATATLARGQTGVVTFDVTEDVRALAAGQDAHHGWLLKSLVEYGPGSAVFGSRESATPPRLLIVVRTGTLTGYVAGTSTDFSTTRSLAGARVRANAPGSPETITDAEGRFVLPRVRLGFPVVVVADGYGQSHGRVALVTTALTTVAPVVSRAVDRVWYLPALAPAGGTPLTTDPAGHLTADVTITGPEAGGAIASIPAGAKVELPAGYVAPIGSGVVATLHRVSSAVIANALPLPADPTRRWYAPFFYSLQPEGARVSSPIVLRLPNDQQLPPSTPVTFRQFDPARGIYVESGTLTVTADGAALEGTIEGLFGPGAPVTLGHAHEYTGHVDATGLPVHRALFHSAGVPMGEFTSTSGVLAFRGTVPVPPDRDEPVDFQFVMMIDDAPTYALGRYFGLPTGPTTSTGGWSAAATSELIPILVGPEVSPVTCTIIGWGSSIEYVILRSAGGLTYTVPKTGGSEEPPPGTPPAQLPSYVYFDSPAGLVPDGEYRVDGFIFAAGKSVQGGIGAKGYADATPPTASIGPSSDPTATLVVTNQSSVTVRIEGHDATGGIRSLAIERRFGSDPWVIPPYHGYNAGSAHMLQPKDVVLDVTIPRQLPFPEPLLTGAVEFRVFARDSAAPFAASTLLRNEIHSAPLTIIWDSQAPKIDSFTGPPPTFYKDAITFAYTVHDDIDRIALVRIEEQLLSSTQWTPIDSRPHATQSASGSFTVPTPLTSRQSRYRIVVRDRAGNETTSSPLGTYTLDNQEPACVLAPLAPISTPLNAPSVPVVITGSVTEVGPAGLERWILRRVTAGTTGSVELARQDGLNGATSALVNANDQVPDGRYVYVLEGVDRATNLGTVQSNVLVVDTQPPKLISFTPADGTVYGPGAFLISAVLEENRGLDPALLSLTCDGAELPVSVITVRNAAGFEITTVTALIVRLLQGTHTIRLSASDGAQAVVHTVQVTQDHTPPVFDSITPSSELITSATPVTFSATYHDGETVVVPALVKVELQTNNGPKQDVTAQATVTATDATFTQALADGTHVVTFTIVDGGGSTAVRATKEVVVDTQAPTVALTRAPPPLPSFTTASDPIEADYSDAGSGIAAVRVYLDGLDVTALASVAAGKVRYSVPASTADGSHTVRIEAVDRAGLTTQVTASFQLDRTAPSAPGVPVAGARPFEPTTTLRWVPSVDTGAGGIQYLVLRAEDGKTFTQVATTTAAELTVPFPTGERTAFRVIAEDALGNRSAPANAKGCEVAGVEDVNRPVTTAFRVEVTYPDGTPVTTAMISERSTTAPLTHVGNGRYESAVVPSIPAGQILTLDLVVDGDTYVSGPLLPLLPETVLTDFGRFVAAKRRLITQVVGIAGESPSSGLLHTLGEPIAAGPPPATGSRQSLLAGFWHTVDDTTGPLVAVLQLPPVICTRYVPIYFEVVADGPTDVTAELSTDGGVTWRAVTVAAGSLQALPAVPLGQRHAIVWDVGQDVANESLVDVRVRLFPSGQPERGGSVDATLVRAFSVTSVEPPSGTLDLDPQGPITLTFDHGVTSTAGNLASSITLTDPDGTTYALSFSVAGNVLTATPQAALPTGVELQLRVVPGLLPDAGPLVFDQHPLTPGLQPFEASYRVGGADVTPPSLLSSLPVDGVSGVALGTPIVVVFDEDLDPSSVGPNTFVLTSSADGNVPVSVVLLPDQRTVQVQPASALLNDRCYTLTIGPSLRDVAGNALGRAEHVTFATIATSPATPPPPVITFPASGDALTQAAGSPVVTTQISGTAARNVTLQLFVNGYPTGVFGAADADGNFAFQSCDLPDGDVTLSAIAMHPSGFPASGPSAPVLVTVTSSRLSTTPPPSAGSPPRVEVVAGAGPQPYFRRELTFTGTPGQPFELRLASLRTAAGPLVSGDLRVNAANGGGTFPLRPGVERLAAGLFFDSNGEAKVDLGNLQVAGDGWAVSLVDPLTGTETPAQQVSAQRAAAFLSFTTDPSLQLNTLSCSLATRARLLTPGGAHEVIACPGYGVRVRAFDALLGTATDSVTINGLPGSTGAIVAMDALGNATITAEILDRTSPFYFVATATTAFEDGYNELVEQSLCESDPAGGSFYSQTRELSSSLSQNPINNANWGRISCVPHKPCDCDEDSPPEIETTADNKGTGPVVLHNLGETLSVTDIHIPSPRGPSFTWTRSYKSFVLYSGVHGHRWTAGYEQRLVRKTGEVAWVTGTTRQETFTLQPDGSYRSPTGVNGKLVVQSNIGVIRDSGTRLFFRSFNAATAPGELDRIVDRDGLALRFEYGTTGSGANRISAVFDANERRVAELFYDLFGRIARIRDLTGREWRYEYSTQGDLVRVTLPAALNTTEGEPLLPGQQFPDGRQLVYGYTTGYADERLNHLLRFMVKPEEARALASLPAAALTDPARLGPLAYIETTYEDRPESSMFSRVTKQRVGGSSMLPAWTGVTAPQEAGGTFTFHLEALPVPANASLNHPVSVTRFTDRMGNQSEYFHNKAGQCVRLREYANRNLRPRGTGYGEDPEYFERTWIYDKDGQCLAVTNPSGSVWRWIFGNEDLDGDGALTSGDDRNGDGDFDDPEDVQPEDDPRFAYRPGNGVLDQKLRNGQRNMVAAIKEPDARGDSRGGQRPRVWTYTYEPVYDQLRTVTDPCGNDPTYTPQNGGVATAARYTTTFYRDYEQGPVATTRTFLAQELGVTGTELDQLLADAGIVLGRGDLNGSNADNGQRAGRVVRVEAPSVTLSSEQTALRAVHGPTQAIVSLAEHNVFGQLIRTVDPEHNVHRFEYHPEGDVNGDGVADSNLTGPTGGFLNATIVDDSATDPLRNTGTNLAAVKVTTRFFQDALGHTVRTIDPRGVEHRTSFNAFDEVVRTRVASAIPGPVTEPALVALDYEALVLHDHDGRVVETRVENAGERDGTAATVASNPYWTGKTAYDLLGQPVVSLAEVEPIAADDSITVRSPGVIVSSFAYDKNLNLRLVTKPEGNQTAIVYDERRLPFQVIDGFGSADQGTVTFHYTVNGAPQLTVDAVKHNPTKWPQFPGDVSRTKYDGFDEELCTTDAEYNCGDRVYDPCGRPVRSVRHGPPEEGLPRLAEAESFYDELGRAFRSEVRLFETQTPFSYPGWDRSIPLPGGPVLPASDTEIVSTIEQDALGRLIRSVDPALDESRVTWDGAGRVVKALGPSFSNLARLNAVHNEARFFYNQAGQPVTIETVDRSPVAGVPEQTFPSTAAYDALGRLFQATDPIGLTSRRVFDSRSNVIAVSDANSSVTNAPNLPGLLPTLVNGHGNVARTFYDGLSRPIRTEVLLKKNGTGDGTLDDTNLDTSNASNPDGKITITQTYDRNSRLRSRSDDNGNTTGYAYDARDRAAYVMGADLTVQRTIYDADSFARQTIDRNGTTLERTFDAVGRLLRIEATRRATNLEQTGQAVEGTAVQAFEYDGLHRLRLAVDQNDPTGGADDVVTEFTYDSLSRQRTETHRFRAQAVVANTVATSGRITITSALMAPRTISRTFTADSNRETTTYSSGRTLTYQLDGLDRLQAISDGQGLITATEFLGGRPIASMTGRGTVTTAYAYLKPQDRRLTKLTHTSVAGHVAGLEYEWDAANLRRSERSVDEDGQTIGYESYSYDSASRVTRVAHNPGDPRPDTSWVIDGVGNWVSRTKGGETQTTNQRVGGKYAPDLMNEVSRLATFDVMGALQRDEVHTQDPNGNRIISGEFRLSFDAFDRLVRVERTSDNATVGRYRYDALGRRVDRFFVPRGSAAGQLIFHVHDGAQEVEELNASDQVTADFVWGGQYIDQCVQIRRGLEGLTPQEYHLHTNSIFSVVAVTDASGQVVERYSYSSIYGVAQVQDAAGAPRASTETGNPWRFQGRRFDPETSFYYFRLRHLDPEQGRFVSRDPIGIWGDNENLGNAYALASNNTINFLDPFGLDRLPHHHLLPQEHREVLDGLFGKGFIDKFTLKLGQRQHEDLHRRGWNKLWDEFLKSDAFLSACDNDKKKMVMKQLKDMAEAMEDLVDLSKVRPYRGKLSEIPGSSAGELADAFRKHIPRISPTFLSRLTIGLMSGLAALTVAAADSAEKVLCHARFKRAYREYLRGEDEAGDRLMRQFIAEDLPAAGLPSGAAVLATEEALKTIFGL